MNMKRGLVLTLFLMLWLIALHVPQADAQRADASSMHVSKRESASAIFFSEEHAMPGAYLMNDNADLPLLEDLEDIDAIVAGWIHTFSPVETYLLPRNLVFYDLLKRVS